MGAGEPGERASTIDIAALLHATGADGRVDPLAFAAQRLILQHESIDVVDAKALAEALLAEPFPAPGTAPGIDRDALIGAVLERLPADVAQRVRTALAGGPAAPNRPAAPPARRFIWNDPRTWFPAAPGRRTRWPDHSGLSNMDASRVREARRRTAGAYAALGAHADPEAFRAEFVGNEDFRNFFLGLALIYIESGTLQAELERGAQVDILRVKAVRATVRWYAGLKEAEDAGEADRYLAETWDIGLDAAVCAMPAANFEKFCRAARSYFENGLSPKDPAVAVAIADVARARRRATERAETGR
jgi:hypothetical protein